MALETTTYIDGLVSTNPVAGDAISAGDDHIRLIKSAVKATFPNLTGAVTPTHTELNYVDGVTSAIQTQLDAKAALASPTFTGTPTLPTGTIATTQSAGDSSTKVATTAFVSAAVAGAWDLILSSATGTGATFDLVNGSGGVVLDSTYDVYAIELIAVKPGTDAVSLWLRTSTNAGGAYDAAASDYIYSANSTNSSTVTVVSSSGAAQIALVSSFTGSAAGEDGVYGQVLVYRPATAQRLYVQYSLAFRNSSAEVISINGTGIRDAADDVDAIRLLFSSGNFASGTINLYGRRK